jgi:hypothetical protein
VRTFFAGLCFGIAVALVTKALVSFTNAADVQDAGLFAAMFSLAALLLVSPNATA